MSNDEVGAAINILRRTSPEHRLKTLVGIATLNSDLSEHLLEWVERPLEVLWDSSACRYFIASDYNRDSDSYRSPWTNTYSPTLEHPEAYYPSDYVRRLEIEYNEALEAYRSAYYEGGVSSAYFWDAQGGLMGAFLIHKEADVTAHGQGSVWNSVHIVEISSASNQVVYKLTSSVLISVNNEDGVCGNSTVGCRLTRQAEQHRKLSETTDSTTNSHLPYVGRMIEDMETLLQKHIEQLYIPKTRGLIAAARSVTENKAALATDPLIGGNGS